MARFMSSIVGSSPAVDRVGLGSFLPLLKVDVLEDRFDGVSCMYIEDTKLNNISSRQISHVPLS